MAQLSWREMELQDDFKSMSFEDKKKVRDQFFMEQIAPKIDQVSLEDSYVYFLEKAPIEGDEQLKRFSKRTKAKAQKTIGGNMQALGAEIAGEGTDKSFKGRLERTLGRTPAAAGFPAAAIPIAAITTGIKMAVAATDPGKDAIKFLQEAGEGIAESGQIDLEAAGEYGIRRPDSVMAEPIQAAKYYGTQVGESLIGNILPSLAIGRAFGASAGLATMGGIVFGEEYASLRQEGKDHDTAAKISAFRSFTEVVFEVPAFAFALKGSIKFLGPTFNRLLKKGGKAARGTKRVSGTAIIEGISEDFTEISNIMFDKYALGKDITREKFSMRMKDAFISGIGMGGPMGGFGLLLEGIGAKSRAAAKADLEALIRQYYGEIRPKRLGVDNQDLYSGRPIDPVALLPGPGSPGNVQHVDTQGGVGVGVDLTNPTPEAQEPSGRSPEGSYSNPGGGRGPGLPAPLQNDAINAGRAYGITVNNVSPIGPNAIPLEPEQQLPDAEFTPEPPPVAPEETVGLPPATPEPQQQEGLSEEDLNVLFDEAVAEAEAEAEAESQKGQADTEGDQATGYGEEQDDGLNEPKQGKGPEAQAEGDKVPTKPEETTNENDGNQKGERGGEHPQREDEASLGEEAGGERVNRGPGTGQREGGIPGEGVEPLRSEEPDGDVGAKPQVEPDETTGAGESAPAAAEYEIPSEYDAPTIAKTVEKVRAQAESSGLKDVEGFLHQAIGNIIEGNLSGASFRLNMASDLLRNKDAKTLGKEIKALNLLESALKAESKRIVESEAAEAGQTETPPAGKKKKAKKKKSVAEKTAKGKLENTGQDLRRWWDKLKAEQEKATTEGEKLWRLINLKTQRGKLFNPQPGENATPGVARYYSAVQQQLNTFSDVGNLVYHEDFVGRLRSYRQNTQQYIISHLNKSEDFPNFKSRLLDFASEYASMMNAFSDYMSGANTILEAEAKLDALFETDKNGSGNYRAPLSFDVSRESIPHMSFVDSKEPSLDDIDRASRLKREPGKPQVLTPIPLGNNASRRLAQLLIGRKLYDSDNTDNGNWKTRKLREILDAEKETEDPNKKRRLIRPRHKEHSRDMQKSVRGGDVTPQKFKKEFGFADIGFGGWVAKGRDQTHLNGAWDAFADLADSMGIDRRAIGFYGKLHFTIGALGHGKHAAHFSPNQPSPKGGTVPVINVTNTSGDGTVAHEWGHALDYEVLRQTRQGKTVLRTILQTLKSSHDIVFLEERMMSGIRSSSYMTHYSVSGRPGSAENVRALVEYHAAHLPITSFRRDANELGKSYWGNDEELLARSWEAFIYDNLGGVNTYLVTDWVSDGEVNQEGGYRGSPYPAGEERALFNDVYKALLKSIITDSETSIVSIDLDAFEENLPKSIAEFDSMLDKLIASIPKRIEQYANERVEASQRRKEESEKAEESAWADAAAEAEAEKSVDAEIAKEEAADQQGRRSSDPASVLSGEDLGVLFDEALSEAQESEQENPEQPPLQESPGDPEGPPRRSAKDMAAEAAKDGVEGMKDIMDGLSKLFPPSDLNSFPPNIDKARYEAAKPHFQAALIKYRRAGKTLKELFVYLIKQLGAGIKPYLIYFAQDESLSMDLREPVAKAVATLDPETMAGFLYGKLNEITDNNKLKAALKEFSGQDPTQIDIKRGQEALELALVVKAREIVAYGKEHNQRREVIFGNLVDLYTSQPTLSSRSSTSIENQAYSTPMPLAFLASELAGIDHNSTVYEPTAGNGALLIGANPNNSTTNELNSERAQNLRDLGFVNTTENDASNWSPQAQVDAVVANPPFGALAVPRSIDGYTIKAIDHMISGKALTALKDNGKAVLIIGANMGASAPIRGSKKVFLNYLYSRYNVVDIFEVDGDLYRKQGAGWPVMVVTIDGRNKTQDYFKDKPQRLTSWRGIYEHVEEVLGAQGAADTSADSNVDTGQQAGGPGGSRTAPGEPDGGAGGGAGGRAGQRVGLEGGEPDSAGRESTPGRGENEAGGAAADTDGVGPAADGGTANDQVRQPGSEPASGEQRGDVRGEAGRPHAELGSEYQVAYKPRSKGPGENVLVPVNMLDAINDSLDELESAIGMKVDEYVMKKLAYPDTVQLFDAFMALQVDAVAAAIYNFESKGKGVIIADQTGVGKGRQAAAMIRYALLNNMVPVFATAKANLFTDMYDDILDINEKSVVPFIFNSDGYVINRDDETKKRFKNTKSVRTAGLDSMRRGRMPAGANTIFMTYSQIKTDNPQRAALLGMINSKMKPMFILDESHNVAGDREKVGKKKLMVPTGAGFMFNLINDAPVVYLSATYAKRPDNMPIYHRTDLFDAVDAVEDLEESVVKGGEALQTVLANMLARVGQLFRRELSFKGIDFNTAFYEQDEGKPGTFVVRDKDGGVIRTIKTKQKEQSSELSDHMTRGLRNIVSVDNSFAEWVSRNEERILQLVGELGGEIGSWVGSRVEQTAHHPFTSIVHNFTRQFLLSMKADLVIGEAIRLHKAGEKPVIALENTMESFLKHEIDDGKVKLGSSWGGDYRSILQRALINTRRIALKDKNGNPVKDKNKKAARLTIPIDMLPTYLQRNYAAAETLIDELPVRGIVLFYIDYIRNGLEKAGISVGEITGRTYVMDYSGGGSPVLQRRPTEEVKNRRKTINKFNNGSLDALILNAAGSTGLSIHASEKFRNLDGSPQKKRHMLVAQAMGDINVLMQMFGRINRTGQVEERDGVSMLPEYTQMGLDLPSEKRPMAMTARKMRSLNANTSANTESETTLDVSSIFNKYGDLVVNEVLLDRPDVADMLGVDTVSSGSAATPGFAMKATGRLALAPVELQAEIWEQILESYASHIELLDAMGMNDLKLLTMDLDAKIKDNKVIYEGKDPTTVFGGNATLHKVSVKLTGNAPRGSDVALASDKALSGRSPAAAVVDLVGFLSSRNTKTGELKKAHEDTLKEYKELSEKSDIKDEDVAEHTKATKDIRAKLNAAIERSNSRQLHVNQVESLIRSYPIRSAWKLDVGDDLVTGVVTNVESKHKEGVGDPYAMSSIIVTFMVNSPVGTVRLPLSKIAKGKYIDHKLYNMTPERVKNLFDSQYRGSSREDRYVVTGNLISGLSEVQTGGLVIAFTAANGKRYNGIILPRKFGASGEWSAAGNRPIMIRDYKDAIKYLNKISESRDTTLKISGLSNRNQEVRVYSSRWDAGISFISIRKRMSKASNKVKFDKELRSMVGDFAGSGTTLQVQFPTSKLSPVVRRLSEINILYAPSTGRATYEEATGRKLAVLGDINLSFDDGQQDKSLEYVPEGVGLDDAPRTSVTESKNLPKISSIISRIMGSIKMPGAGTRGKVDAAAEYVRKVINSTGLDAPLEQGDVETVSRGTASAQVRVVERISGKKIVFFRVRGNKKVVYQGLVTRRSTNTIYINIDAPTNFVTIAGHELWHLIEFENPRLASELAGSLIDNVDIGNYINRLAAAKGITTDRVSELEATSEIMGDLIGDLLGTEEALRDLESKSPATLRTLIGRFVEWLTRTLSRMKKGGLGSGRYFKDIDAARTAAMDMLREYRDAPAEGRDAPESGNATSFDIGSFSVRRDIRDVGDMWTRNAEGYFDKAAAVGRRWYSPLGDLVGTREYLIKRYLMLGNLAKIDELAKRINQAFEPTLHGLRALAGTPKGKEQRARIAVTKKQVYAFLIDPRGIPSSISNVPARNNAVKIKQMLDGVGKDLVDSGLLSEEAYLQHKDGYLPQLYLKYLLKPGVYSDLGLGGKVSSMGYRKERVLVDPKDADEARLRRVILGEVKDPGFLASVSIGRAMRDMAMLDFMLDISKQKDESGVAPLWVHPDFLIEWEGEKVTVFWLQAESERLWNQARHVDKDLGDGTFLESDPAKEMRDLAKKMRTAVAEREDETERDVGDYRQMPNTAQYGRLRGMWVRKEIHSDLVGIHSKSLNKSDVGGVASFLDSMFSVGGIGTKMTQWWKVLKVPLNPPTQVRNFISNMVLLNLSGVPMHMLPGLVVEAVSQISNQGQYYRIAMKWGVSKSTFASQELATLHTDLIKIRKDYQDDGSPKQMVSMAVLIGSHIVEGAGGVYQKMETLGKTMKIMYEMRENKLDEAGAALSAHKALFDYSLIPNTVKWLRNSPWGMPFVTFQYKVLPNLLETAVKYPWRYAPYVALPFAMSALLQVLFDVEDDDLKKLRKALPEWMENKGHMYLLPYKTEDGRWDVFDFSFFLPWSMYTETAESVGSGELSALFTETGIFAGPLSQAVVAVTTGIDSFTKRPIWNEDDPMAWQMLDTFNYLWSLVAPSWVTETGFLGKLYRKAGWSRLPAYDEQLRSNVPLSHALAKLAGINLYRVDPQLTRERNLGNMLYIINRRKRRANRDIRQPGLSQEQMEKRIQKWTEDIDPRIQQMYEYEEESRIHPNLK